MALFFRRNAPPSPAASWHPYALCLAATALAAGLQAALAPWLAPSPSLLLLAVPLLAARLAGPGPAALSTLGALLLGHVLLHDAPATSLLLAGLAALGTWALSQAPAAGAPAPAPELALALGHLGDAVLLTDAQGRVRVLNPVAAYLTGWREPEALGLPLAQVLRLTDPDARTPLALAPLPSHAARPVQLGLPALLLSRHGCELPVEYTASLLSDSRGRPLGTLVVLRDTSARFREEHERNQLLARERDAHLEAETQRARLQALFLQAPVAICLTRGPDHLVELVNPLGQALVGERLRPGHSVRGFVSALDPHLLRLLDDVFHLGTPYVGHEVPLRADFSSSGLPEVRHFDVTWQPWRGPQGEILGTLGLCAEVTEQVLARREVEALASDLQKALQIRDDFLSIASHELKTPLTSLQLQLQLLWRSLPETGPEGQPHPARQRIEATRRPAERLHLLVNNLLDVSRIRADRLSLEPETVDFAALLQEVVARSETDAAGAGCALRLHAAAPVVGRWDRLRLEQVVTNLLSNAIKYGAAHPVELAVVQDGARALLTVRDHGIGIPPEHQARIFQRFERAVSERHYGGFGLGLWICKQIVESLGGDIRVDSQAGQGATFTVSLPLQPSVPGEPSGPRLTSAA